jgi:lactate 2-monooxygenase
MPDFGAYQNEIYLAGLSGRLRRFPISLDDLEAKAHAAMAESLVSYVAGGCGRATVAKVGRVADQVRGDALIGLSDKELATASWVLDHICRMLTPIADEPGP